MAEMTTYERMKRMYEHREADRVPITDSPWGATIERWHREGMPRNVSFVDYFGLDRFVRIGADNSPRYPVRVLEETEEYLVTTSSWGATMRSWKHAGGVPEFLDFTIKDPDSWAKAKERMQPTPDRINWDVLKRNYRRWREEGAWISAGFWFGFDVTHSWAVGTERLLIAMIEQPDWVVDMFNHFLDVDLALFQMVWDAGYHFDEITWPDDMGYKNSQFFSLDMYRELLKPVHKRAADWAHAKGVKVRLHSCGDIRPFIPDLIEVGIDMLNPLEVKAGMDPIQLKREYGDRLAFHGGINAVLYDHPEELWEEMHRVIPVMKENGGYVISSDHSVPQTVSLEVFRTFVNLAKELGSYEQ
jgi:uroporphyrinogen decarboxylase